MEDMRDLFELSNEFTNNMHGGRNHRDKNKITVIDESNVKDHLYPVTNDSPLSELGDSDSDVIDEKIKLVDPMSVENLTKQSKEQPQSGGDISAISTSKLIYNRNKMMYVNLR